MIQTTTKRLIWMTMIIVLLFGCESSPSEKEKAFQQAIAEQKQRNIEYVNNRRFIQKDMRIGNDEFEWSFGLTNAYGRKIEAEGRTYHQLSVDEMMNMMVDMEQYGVDKRIILLTAQVCFGKVFHDAMRYQEIEHFRAYEDYWAFMNELSFKRIPGAQAQAKRHGEMTKLAYEKMIAAYDGYSPPMKLGYGNNKDCNTLRKKVTTDENSPFYLDWLGVEFTDDSIYWMNPKNDPNSLEYKTKYLCEKGMRLFCKGL